MKIIITPYEVTKQIEFNEIESYWVNPSENYLEMTRFNGNKIVYNLKLVEWYEVEN